jgi:hypothetical protein
MEEEKHWTATFRECGEDGIAVPEPKKLDDLENDPDLRRGSHFL